MDFGAGRDLRLVQGTLKQSVQHNLQRSLWKTRTPAAAHLRPAHSPSAAGVLVLPALCGRPLALLEGKEVLVAHTCLVQRSLRGQGAVLLPSPGRSLPAGVGHSRVTCHPTRSGQSESLSGEELPRRAPPLGLSSHPDPQRWLGFWAGSPRAAWIPWPWGRGRLPFSRAPHPVTAPGGSRDSSSYSWCRKFPFLAHLRRSTWIPSKA